MDNQHRTWTCCECKKTTNLTANTIRCTNCQHDKCRYCSRGTPSPRPGPPGTLFSAAHPRYLPSTSSSYQYPSTATSSYEFSTPRPLHHSQPSTAPRQYALGAYPPPPPPPAGLGRNTDRHSSGIYSSSVSSTSGYPFASASGAVFNSAIAHHDSSSRRSTGHGRSFIGGGGGGLSVGRPSNKGWWVCSECGYENNPALAPELCTQCPHRKCPYCQVW